MLDEDDVLTPKNMNTVLEFSDNATADSEDDFYHLATSEFKYTEIFDGLQVGIKMGNALAEYDYLNSGWMPGEAPININLNKTYLKFYGWDYNMVFTDQHVYTTKILERSAVIRDNNGTRIDKNEMIFDYPFNFYIENINFTDSLGQHPMLDMIAHDQNGDGLFNLLDDRILVGAFNQKLRWDGGAVLFTIDFKEAQDESQLPKNNDVYTMRHIKPWFKNDSLSFTVNVNQTIDAELTKNKMQDIRVVPNPYVASNLMEQSVVNKFLNQRRRILFTNLPERCSIKIITVSGVLIRELVAPDDALTSFSGFGDTNTGLLHWDMLTKEGLEIAAGMYFYHVKDDNTGEEISGKFAVIK
jgi:hypothetical protein